MILAYRCRRWLAAGFVCAYSGLAHAGVTVHVQDDAGKAVADAAVYLEGGPAQAKSKRASAEIEQRNKTFIPLVTVVQTGTEISFPNNDTVRHHVYSFSPAKSFDLKLYAGKPAAPVLFDKSGTVVLGCNIHDQMLAYVQVVDTPYFAKTDANGNAKIASPASGKYSLKVWHYMQPAGSAVHEQSLDYKGDADINLTVKLGYKAG